MNFRKKGGRNDDPKNFVADFSTPEKKAQHSFPKIHPKWSIEASLRNRVKSTERIAMRSRWISNYYNAPL